MEEVSPQGLPSPLFQEKRKLPPAPQSSQLAAPLAVETHDAHGPSGPPLHQLAIAAPAPRQNDDSVGLELTQGLVESVDVYFTAVGQFSLDRPEALLRKPVLVIQTASVSLLARTKNHDLMLGPKVLHGRIDISGPVCPKEREPERATNTGIRKSPGYLRGGISVHVALQLSRPKSPAGRKRRAGIGASSQSVNDQPDHADGGGIEHGGRANHKERRRGQQRSANKPSEPK
jgi:hypothetical protein